MINKILLFLTNACAKTSAKFDHISYHIMVIKLYGIRKYYKRKRIEKLDLSELTDQMDGMFDDELKNNEWFAYMTECDARRRGGGELGRVVRRQ